MVILIKSLIDIYYVILVGMATNERIDGTVTTDFKLECHQVKLCSKKSKKYTGIDCSSCSVLLQNCMN